jgi:hypothetical protein
MNEREYVDTCVAASAMNSSKLMPIALMFRLVADDKEKAILVVESMKQFGHYPHIIRMVEELLHLGPCPILVNTGEVAHVE